MKKYFLILTLFSLLMVPVLVFAQETQSDVIGSDTQSDVIGSDTQSDKIACPCTPGAVCLCNPLSVSTPQALIGKVINAILGVVGSLALLMFVYGGLTWMTSSGNQEKVKKGRDIIVWSAIGLAVIFVSYALTRFILSTIAQ